MIPEKILDIRLNITAYLIFQVMWERTALIDFLNNLLYVILCFF